MANFAFNISKGRELEYHERVNNNDPANAALILVVLAEAGLDLRRLAEQAYDSAHSGLFLHSARRPILPKFRESRPFSVTLFT